MDYITLIAFAIAVVICAAAAVAIAGHVIGARSPRHLLLWFGLFSAAYGVRMFFQQPLAPALEIDRTTALWFENGLSYAILIPALLFLQELYGAGWRRSLAWLTAAVAAFTVVALAVDAAARNPVRVQDPSLIVLALVGAAVLIGLRAGYRPPAFEEWRVLAAGVTIFLLFVANEHAVGARIVPWRFGGEPIGFLAQLACFGYIALTRVFAQGRQLAAVDQEMRSAREIQQSILPRALPAVSGARVAARYVPLAAVAGDFYDVVARVSLVGARRSLVADVSGHGVPAALIASMVKVAFAGGLRGTDDPGVVLERMNTTLCGMFERSFVTAACAVLHPAARSLTYALAGHPPPLLLPPAGGNAALLDERGVFLGFDPLATYNAATVTALPGARLVLYTDGVIETPNSGDDLFGIERLTAFASRTRAQSSEGFADSLIETLRLFTGSPTLRHDDVTLLIVDLG